MHTFIPWGPSPLLLLGPVVLVDLKLRVMSRDLLVLRRGVQAAHDAVLRLLRLRLLQGQLRQLALVLRLEGLGSSIRGLR